MGRFDGYKPVMAMVGLQCIYAGLALFTRAALLQGMSPRVFVVYRQGVATLILAPIVCLTRWYISSKSHLLSISLSLFFLLLFLIFFFFGRRNPFRTSLGLRSFSLIFVTSLIG